MSEGFLTPEEKKLLSQEVDDSGSRVIFSDRENPKQTKRDAERTIAENEGIIYENLFAMIKMEGHICVPREFVNKYVGLQEELAKWEGTSPKKFPAMVEGKSLYYLDANHSLIEVEIDQNKIDPVVVKKLINEQIRERGIITKQISIRGYVSEEISKNDLPLVLMNNAERLENMFYVITGDYKRMKTDEANAAQAEVDTKSLTF
ncbi:hypothetical protein A2533_00410 [Candidatus Falkowbacteria bacterium RIFOXYD2_FULL_35_9]|uniref:Uncharacterized protein n=1 Tax=Candidatus Falkowbacteria bacterium RIFOXYC2_FULL_36_12 TaxID=1798002 RepID=A0A1F5T373_9BACT|nr:MAG: hypothetical protein A2300_01870 [Candidatus Falkowbacteria bacterium RIFOXYB2_FULL_35_7]OGF33046.1 MAG: hypothetical protein A2223_04095 [Candidatus Falkowbacteria bacterium RIFOXYA2_FULL_35_8]OGF33407.1 MAG: hypothetical protein A2478_01765 [Candidatus Falkowbacteria bacterium RIFOXYC2_FULL_36_12]OGF46541.1 MAG: hypothetical protein A2533_00410 [Candidatus Falkowbacteria bacterium RIFOXYD2_FULL_35_9]